MWFLTQLQKLYHIEASTLVTYEANMFVTNFKEFPLFDIISEGNSNVLNLQRSNLILVIQLSNVANVTISFG